MLHRIKTLLARIVRGREDSQDQTFPRINGPEGQAYIDALNRAPKEPNIKY